MALPFGQTLALVFSDLLAEQSGRRLSAMQFMRTNLPLCYPCRPSRANTGCCGTCAPCTSYVLRPPANSAGYLGNITTA